MVMILERAKKSQLVQTCLKISISPFFSFLIALVIIINTVILSFDSYPKNPKVDKAIEITNYITFGLFTLEMLIKIIGLGVKLYAKDRFNLFDTFIILMGVVEMTLNASLHNDNNSALSVFRGFRIIRLFKLASSWESLNMLLSTILTTIKDIRNFSVLLLVCLFTYTVLGMELFAHRIKFNREDIYDMDNGVSPRMNFDSFETAFASIFNVLHGEDWQLVMYNAARSVGEVTIIFFVALVIIGQIILLNLLIAVLLENFEEKRRKFQPALSTLEEEKKPFL